jgi:hypothetical protein
MLCLVIIWHRKIKLGVQRSVVAQIIKCTIHWYLWNVSHGPWEYTIKLIRNNLFLDTCTLTVLWTNSLIAQRLFIKKIWLNSIRYHLFIIHKKPILYKRNMDDICYTNFHIKQEGMWEIERQYYHDDYIEVLLKDFLGLLGHKVVTKDTDLVTW